MGVRNESIQRRHYQSQVAALLEQIEERRRRQAVLAAYGVRPGGMQELEHELRGLRDELAALTA
jgi:hypothetical protein